MSNPYFSDEFIKELSESIRRTTDAFIEAGKAIRKIFEAFPPWMFEDPKKERYQRRYARRKKK